MLKRLLMAAFLLVAVGFANPFLAAPEQAGITTYDFQQNENVGDRIAIDKDGNAHIFWMHSVDQDPNYPNRDIYYNFWNAGTSVFDFTGGTKASGVARAGYCTGGVLSDGRAIVAFHEVSGAQNFSAVAVDAAQGFGSFSTPVRIDQSKEAIWPHMVVGSDDIIHVVAQINDTTVAGEVVYYSRSTDKGQTFSTWKSIATDAEHNPTIAVSPDGKKVAVVWSCGIGARNLWFQHVKYVESTNGGVTWGSPVTLTADRYPTPLPSETDGFIPFAFGGDYDAFYDNNGNLNITFGEFAGKLNPDDTWSFYNICFKRIIHWNKASGFHLVSGSVTTYTPMNADTVVTTLDSLHMWGSGFSMMDADNQVQAVNMGDWKPQGTLWGNNKIIIVWCGQWDSLDMNAAGRLNGDLYVSMTSDNGKTWLPVRPWNQDDIHTHADSTKMYWTNITNTHTPGGDPGACDGEDWFSVARSVYSNQLHITYILDKFSGPSLWPPTENIFTENPVMYLRYELVGIEESPIPQTQDAALVGSGPFNGQVSFRISAPTSNASLKIYNTSGALVKTLVSGSVNSGTISWNASTVPAGVYFYSFSTPTKTSNGRFVLVH